MGRGRNSWLMQGGSVYTSGGVTYYSSAGPNTKGIQKSTTIGFNYSDKFGKDTDLDNLSLIHINNNLETRSKVSRTTLLPDYILKQIPKTMVKMNRSSIISISQQEFDWILSQASTSLLHSQEMRYIISALPIPVHSKTTTC